MSESGTRKEIMRRFAALKAARAPFEGVWSSVARVTSPMMLRLGGKEAASVDFRNRSILDNSATIAARTLASGLMSGVTSPARPWFRLTLSDPALIEQEGVAPWLDDVQRRMMHVFARSNLYNALHRLYEDLGPFGVAAMIVHEDPDKAISCEILAMGRYWLAQNARGEVDVLYREYSMTAAQIVEEFAPEAEADANWRNLSHAVRSAWERRDRDVKFAIIQAIEPNPDFKVDSPLARQRRYRSVTLESGGEDGLILRQSGYDSFPAMCPRWSRIGDDVYGSSPGMVSLGDAEQLQIQEKIKARAIEKMVDPPLLQSGDLASPINDNPSGVTIFAANGGATPMIQPLYAVSPRIAELAQDMETVRQRIRDAYFVDLWLMISQMDRSGVTATEIDARREEKMLALGPVLEALHHELLDPLIERTFAIMERAGLIPPAPEALAGAGVLVEYTSVLDQAQKAIGAAAIERMLGFASRIAGADPSAALKIDFEQSVDEYQRAIGAPAGMVRSDEAVAALKQAQAEAAARQQRMEQEMAMLQTGAQTAKTLSETDTGAQNALTDAMRMLGA